MTKSGQCQFLGPCAAPRRSGAFVYVHPQARIGKGDCGGEAVRSRPDDDRVRSITHAVWSATAGTVL